MENQREEKGKKQPAANGMTRRRFLKTVGSTAAAAAATDALAGLAGAQVARADAASAEPAETFQLTLQVNGRPHRLAVEARWSLLFVLREKLGLTATKVGCERGECGACTVLIDGVPRYSCLTLAVEAEGSEIVTLEGLMRGEELGPVQQAFAEQDGFQCGYCTPGQIMAAEGLLRKNPVPNQEDIRLAMSGNICRCGAYPHIFKAVAQAAELKERK